MEYATKKKNNRIPQFKSAAGTTIEPEGYYSVPLKINKNILSRHTFYVVPHLEDKCILGMDFMKSHRMKIDRTKKEVTISRFGKKAKIPLTDEPYPLYSIKEDKEANKLKHLKEKDQQIIRNVLEKNENIFAEKLNELGRTNIVQHEVRTTGEM